MPWRTVPDLCIIAVLKQMPLIDQLTAGNISPRWNILLRAANRRVRYLAIFCGDSINQEYVSPFSIDSRSLSLRMLTDDNGKTLYPVTRLTKWNCLLIKSWKNAEGQSLITVGQIANAFSAITELNFDTGRLDDYQHLVDMLEHPNWKHHLNSFSLNDHYKSSNNKPALSPTLNKHLFVAINGLSSLRHLAINWINGLKMTDDLSIIAQLKILSAKCVQYHFSAIVPSLERYAAENKNLQMILRPESTVKISRLSNHIRNQVIHLSNAWFPFSSYKLSLLAPYRSLSSIKFETYADSIQKDFAYFSQLQQLVHLSLTIDLVADAEADKLPPKTVLLGVKALDVFLYISDHSQVQWLNLTKTLPNVQVIHVAFVCCESCHTTSNDLMITENDSAEGDATKEREKALQCVRDVLPQVHLGLPLHRIILDWSNYRNAEQLCFVQL